MTSSPDGALSLSALQDWLRLAVTTPGGLTAGLRRARERYGETRTIRVPEGADAGERLSIYARGYLDRLLACLRADYPAVRALVGDALFDGFATGYFGARPPRHHSLFMLGAGFADHLERTRPPDDVLPEEQRSLLRLPIDLARAERARIEALRAPGLPNDEGACVDVTGFEPLLRGELCVVAAPCVRVVALGHDVRGFLSAVDRGEVPAVPEARPSLLAVSRVAYRLVLTDLAPWQQRALASCGSPRAVVALAEEVAAASGEEGSAALADLLLWLPTAEGLGMVSLTRNGPAGAPSDGHSHAGPHELRMRARGAASIHGPGAAISSANTRSSPPQLIFAVEWALILPRNERSRCPETRRIVHVELPLTRGRDCHGLQVLLNLAEADKQAAPRVFHLEAHEIPTVELGPGARVRVVGGAAGGVRSPIAPRAPVTLLDVHLAPGASIAHAIDGDAVAFVVGLAGGGEVGPRGAAVSIAPDTATAFGAGEQLEARAGEAGFHFLIAAGRPLGEPVIFEGPLALGSREAIDRTWARFAAGELGRVEPVP
jgi:hypothetical protein